MTDSAGPPERPGPHHPPPVPGTGRRPAHRPKHGLVALAEATRLDLRSRHVGVTLVSPGPVAAGATLDSPFAATPDLLLAADDVAAAVGDVVGLVTTAGARACPTLLRLEPYLDD